MADEETEIGFQLAGALWRYWWWRDHWCEGLEWLEQLLAQNAVHPAEQAVPNAIVAGAYQGAGVLARNLGDYAQAHHFYEQSLALRGSDLGRAAVTAVCLCPDVCSRGGPSANDWHGHAATGTGSSSTNSDRDDRGRG